MEMIYLLLKRIFSMNDEIDLENILKKMLEHDETITYRAISAQHPHFKYPSSITRNSERRKLVENYQAKQEFIRIKAEVLKKQSQSNLIDKITKLEEMNNILTQKNEALTLSHIALYKAVGELGGLALWEKMFERNLEILAVIKQQTPID